MSKVVEDGKSFPPPQHRDGAKLFVNECAMTVDNDLFSDAVLLCVCLIVRSDVNCMQCILFCRQVSLRYVQRAKRQQKSNGLWC